MRPDPADLSRGGRVRVKHVDVVMAVLRSVPGGGARSERRPEAAQEAGAAWLAGQGARHGFSVRGVAVGHYDAVTLPHHVGKRRGAPRLGMMDLSGEIEVTDPSVFLAAQAAGFGRAKAFGCGLMLLRRA